MHLANAVSYITDGEKTQDGLLVGSHNCNIDTALQEMLAIKRKYGKIDKRQGYHFIISFKKQEVRPETAMDDGMISSACTPPMTIRSMYIRTFFSTACHGVLERSTATKKAIGQRRYSPLSMNSAKSTVFPYRTLKLAQKKNR